MEKKSFDLFRKRLEERRRQLRYAMDEAVRDGRDTDLQSPQDAIDRARNSYDKEFLFRQSSNDKRLLRMIETALDCIHQGVFGQCVSCGGEISLKRLEAVPWALRCIECQQKLERQLEHACV